MWFTALCLPLLSEEKGTPARVGRTEKRGKTFSNLSSPACSQVSPPVVAVTCLRGPSGPPSLFRLLPQCPPWAVARGTGLVVPKDWTVSTMLIHSGRALRGRHQHPAQRPHSVRTCDPPGCVHLSLVPVMEGAGHPPLP